MNISIGHHTIVGTERNLSKYAQKKIINNSIIRNMILKQYYFTIAAVMREVNGILNNKI